MATPFQVDTSVIPNGDVEVHVVAPEGELDLATVGEFQEKLDALVDGAGRRLLLDLTGLRFIDSRGVAALYQAYASFARLAVVLGPNSTIGRTLEISGFDQVLPVCDSRVEALRKLE